MQTALVGCIKKNLNFFFLFFLTEHSPKQISMYALSVVPTIDSKNFFLAIEISIQEG